MKKVIKKSIITVVLPVLFLLLFGMQILAAPNPNPTWYVDERVIFHGQCLPYDYYGAKDPSIVYADGKYHVFYTGANQGGGWQTIYTSATTIAGLKNAPRTYMSKIGESYFCAPEVFYFEPQGLWYLVYQDGTYGAAYSTTATIGDPNSWAGPKSFGISGNMGWDYYIICDDTYAYMYNTPSDGSHNLYVRKTTLANFPRGWAAPVVAITDTFEGAEIYKSLSDGQFYLLIEDMKDGRYYELWSSPSAAGPWTKVSEKWAWRGNLVYNADRWTTNVSHGELIRAGKNQKLEINDINRVEFLIQGTTDMSPAYHDIIWDLGLIRNFTGPTPTTPPVITPTPLVTPPPQQNPIWSGGPYTLNGLDDYISLPAGLFSNLGNISLSCWVKLNALETWARIFDFGSDTNTFMMLTPAASSTGNPFFSITTSGTSGEQGINGNAPLATGSWQHIAVVKNGNTGILYINKQEAGRNDSLTLKPADMGTTANNFIGRSQWAQDPYLDANVDKFVIYNRALSASEVTALGNNPPVIGDQGDVNGDGAIDIVDALMIAQYYVGLNPPGFVAPKGDVNCDGSINIIDALIIAQYYVGLVADILC